MLQLQGADMWLQIPRFFLNVVQAYPQDHILITAFEQITTTESVEESFSSQSDSVKQLSDNLLHVVWYVNAAIQSCHLLFFINHQKDLNMW